MTTEKFYVLLKLLLQVEPISIESWVFSLDLESGNRIRLLLLVAEICYCTWSCEENFFGFDGFLTCTFERLMF